MSKYVIFLFVLFVSCSSENHIRITQQKKFTYWINLLYLKRWKFFFL